MPRRVIRRCVQLGTRGARARHPCHRHRGEPRRPRPAGARDRGALRHHARQVPLLGDRRGRLPVAPAARPQHLRRRRLRGPRLRDADRGRPARRRSCGEMGRRRGRLAPSAQPAGRHRARAQDGRRRRDDRDGDLRMAAAPASIRSSSSCCSSSAERAAGAAFSRRSRRRSGPARRPAISASAFAIAPSSGTSSVIRSSARGSRSRASRSQAVRRSAIGAITLSMPASVTPRRMKGITVPGRSWPWARPQAATTPP